MIPALTVAARLSAAVLAAGACGLLAACGSTAAPGAAATHTVTVQAGAGTRATSAAPTPSASSAAAVGPSGCLASGLQARLGVADGAAGTIYQLVVLTNTSDAACTLYGYPGVSFVTGAGGAQVGLPATRNPIAAKRLITLAPGARANFLLAVHDAGAFPSCKIANVSWLRIYPPNDYGSIYVQYKAQACTDASTMGVSVVRAGTG